ncbi:uncharacterized protein ARMOST_14192 [Armillaria ostoyae]|uniref:Tyr recombinase domain-containing protein n=1 Tax=Armillaria ostoyae TaxID=47428 RepID=A0A284RPZ3_ARMOS|nr:uncharacterized protein ARMOST_14192 [Armillaria ostoyae]
MSEENDTVQFNDEIVAALESIVQDFRDAKRTESQTLSLLYGTIGDAGRSLGLALDATEPLSRPYAQQVLAHVEQMKEAAKRGDIGNKDSGEDSNTDGESDSKEKNKKRKRKANRKHKKQRKAATTSSESSSDSGSDSDKPQASYAWRFLSLTGARPTLRPDVIEIRRLIQIYGKNIKKAKRDLRMDLECPSLPDKLWTAILQDDVVDFDEIFSSINSATIDNEKTVQIGGGISLALNTVKASTKVTQHGHWVIAWQAYTEAVLFAFPSRRHELNAYLRHINKLFGVCHDSLHYRVINYDRAARIIIGSRRDVLFSDFHEFVHEKTAYIDSVGMAVIQDSVETSKKSVARSRTAPQSQSTSTVDDICRNYNWDTGTAHTYTSALNSYIAFCQLHNFPIQPTEDTLSFFVVYMSYHIKPKSVDTYLSGICNQLEHYFPDVRAVRKSLLVKRTLKGCMRLRGTAVKRKLPLSRPQLQEVLDKINPPTSHDDLLFISMILTGFYGLLRLAEISMPDSKELRDWKKFTRRRSVHVEEDHYSFWLPAHKADTAFEGNKIIIKHRDAVDPRAPFIKYLASRDKLFPIHPLLWVRSNGDCPTRGWFIRKLRTVFPDKRIAGQSMRAGGATALAEDGTAPHIIQATGRWSSDAFQIYIRKNPVLLQAILFSRKEATRAIQSF